MAEHESQKAVYYALGANLGIAMAKGVAAFITGSGSMLAETIHSVADCVNQILLLFGMKRAKLPANEEHPLGYGKAAYFWSFVVAMLLFSMGGLFSIYEGIHKLHTHDPISHVWVAFVVLGISIVLEASSLVGALFQVRRMRKGKSFFHWLKTTRSAEVIVVLGEDLAAVCGLCIAFLFLFFAYFCHMPFLDAVGSICIGAILLVVSFFLIIRLQALLIGKSADPEIQNAITDQIEKSAEIEQVLNAITIQIGPYIMLAAKIKMKEDIDIRTACMAINRVEKNVKASFPELRWSFIEPDICK